MNALHYAAASGQRNLLLNMLQVCDSEALEKPNIVCSFIYITTAYIASNPLVD
jgi:hypothetical protein